MSSVHTASPLWSPGQLRNGFQLPFGAALWTQQGQESATLRPRSQSQESGLSESGQSRNISHCSFCSLTSRTRRPASLLSTDLLPSLPHARLRGPRTALDPEQQADPSRLSPRPEPAGRVMDMRGYTDTRRGQGHERTQTSEGTQTPGGTQTRGVGSTASPADLPLLLLPGRVQQQVAVPLFLLQHVLVLIVHVVVLHAGLDLVHGAWWPGLGQARTD